MSGFPRTTVGGISVSRMIIGTNWFLGFCHTTGGKSRAIQRIVMNPGTIADIIEVFLKAGVDTILCPHSDSCMPEAIAEAEQRVGRKVIIVSTPTFSTTPRTPFDGFDTDELTGKQFYADVRLREDNNGVMRSRVARFLKG